MGYYRPSNSNKLYSAIRKAKSVDTRDITQISVLSEGLAVSLNGLTLGVWPLVSFLLGVKIVGVLLVVFMFNSGAAWDNAKKLIENEHRHKRTPAISGLATQAAAVIGDTVGDSLKDTAGPSLHILIKLENILDIKLLPLFITYALVQ